MSVSESRASEPLSRREAGKAERRRQIIQAAREMIRETGNPGLSMRGLAARAGVSLATPYNLFGSKRAIVVAVLQDVQEFRERFSSVQAADPVEKIFAALEIEAEFYLKDPDFYRTMWTAVFDATDRVRNEFINPKRDAFWLSLMVAAQAAGVLMPDMDPALVLRQMEAMMRSLMFDWTVGDISSERLVPLARHAYAMILLGASAPDWRGPLKARALEAQRALLASPPGA